jgi:hypothetical protein
MTGAALIARCRECGREFDLLDPAQADEWNYGHDCEEVEA